jgi:ParB-like chromosome segregation protein Spo0J
VNIQELTSLLVEQLSAIEDNARIDALNEVRKALHEVSPLKHHPVDLVLWVDANNILGQPLNPNTVAPPEFKLLVHSMTQNGITMPVVSHVCETNGALTRITVDGFHRGKAVKEVPEINKSTMGRLPVTQIRADRTDDASRIAATIEHNRARGEHRVDSMSELVRQLVQAGWRENKIQEELGMGPDELRRMKQLTGLADMFAARDYSEAWEVKESDEKST